MRIGIVSDLFQPTATSGAELSIFDMAERLSHHDDVEVVTVDFGQRFKNAPFQVHYLRLHGVDSPRAQEVDAEVDPSITPVRPFSSLRHHFSFGWQLAALARERKYDLLHTQQLDSTLSAYLTRHWHRRPLVTTLRSYHQASSRWTDPVAFSSGAARGDRSAAAHRRNVGLKSLLSRRALRSCARVFAVSDFVRHVHVDSGLVDPRRATTVHDFLPVVPQELANRRGLRMRYGFESPTILFAGRLDADEGVHSLVKAMEKVAREIPTARLVVAGRGDQRHLRLLASRKGVARNVILEGYVQNDTLLEMMAASDLVAVPSLFSEPLSRVLLEAIALDRPVVATRVGGAAEVVSDRESGYLVEPNDERALGAAMVRALNDQDLPSRTAAANDRLRNGRLNPGRTLERVREAYRAAA